VHAEQHAYYHKHKVIATLLIAIIARLFSRAIAIRLLNNLYYLYFDKTLIARPQLFTLGRATTGASDNATGSVALLLPYARLAFR
jgi:hypothetical protein